MKFSVIIPVYNSASFLNKCIDSLIKQSYKDYELILVDDGSTDESYNICMQFARQYPNVLVFKQENSGPSIARNHGIRMAKGDYLLFVDSDDWVTENYFTVLDEATKQKTDIVFFGILHPNDTIQPEKVFPEQKLCGTSNIVDFLVQNYYTADIHSCLNKAYSRQLFRDDSLWFPQHTVVEEDLLFVLRAVERANTAVAVPQVLYHYNQRSSGSVTTKYNPDKFDCKKCAYIEELAFARRWNSTEFEAIFQDNYLSYISSTINNLMYKACTLTQKQKIQEIRRFYQEETTQNCIRQGSPRSIRSKVMRLLIQGKMYRSSYLLHAVIFRAMGRCKL